MIQRVKDFIKELEAFDSELDVFIYHSSDGESMSISSLHLSTEFPVKQVVIFPIG